MIEFYKHVGAPLLKATRDTQMSKCGSDSKQHQLIKRLDANGENTNLLVLARRPRFPIGATKFRVHFAQSSRSPFWLIWGFQGVWGEFSQLLPMQNLTSDSCSAIPIFYWGDENFAPILLSYRDPHFELFEGFGGIQLLPVQNLTSYDTQLLTGLNAGSNSVPVCFVFHMPS